MGNLHDMSGFDRNSMIVEFTELAKQGLQTPQPLWMQKDRLPDWAATRKKEWLDSSADRHGIMLEALEESKAAPKPKPEPKAKAEAKPKPEAADKPADAKVADAKATDAASPEPPAEGA